VITSAFSPTGPAYLIGTSPVQVTSTNNCTTYRVRALLTTAQYFTYVAPSGPTTPSITVTAPTAGVPSTFTVGLLPSTVEVFGGLPPNAWFKADAVGAFEIIPGEGL
jgi:hypothetical protein